MNYWAVLFLSDLRGAFEETRFVNGREQNCLIIPADDGQLVRNHKGGWILRVEFNEVPANPKRMTHEMKLKFRSRGEADKAEREGWLRKMQHFGRVYPQSRDYNPRRDRTNHTKDIMLDGVINLSDIPRDKIRLNKRNGKRYVYNLTLCPTGDRNIIYTGLICVDDIPRRFVMTDPYTGRKTLNVHFLKTERIDLFMNTHKLLIVSDDGTELEIGTFKEWKKEGSAEAPQPTPSSDDGEIHNTGVNQRMPDSINGIKF